ncbi:MAG: hypothetical protein HONDAALG_00733 [Gammaproteobacteria bacterium]|nr:hypothetical protein [Gammaproteobacteria bacterium]
MPRKEDGALDEIEIKKLGLRKINGRYCKIKTLIETRGEGGQVLSPLCLPGTHPNGGVYRLLSGELTNIPTITIEEREILLNMARACNEFIALKDADGQREASREMVNGIKPGEDFNARADVCEKVRSLLEEHGWSKFGSGRAGELWSRPGVNDHCSATLFDNGALYVFSTNAGPFDTNKTYSPFATYTLLDHDGGFTAAAKALATQGYGEQRKRARSLDAGEHTDTGAQTVVTQACPYKSNGVGLVWMKQVKEPGGGWAEVPTQLTNFNAEIVGDISRDDGAEQTRVFELRARLAEETAWRSGRVNAADFTSIQKWVYEVLGAKATVYPGRGEHARTAIQLLSREIRTRRVVAHTGWRSDEGQWLYHHVGGAISAEGLVEAEVDLPTSLTPFFLPQPPAGTRLREVVRAVAFDLPKVAADAITLPLIGGVWSAVLTGADFSIFFVGYTGSGKSELAALPQSFFGAGFHAKNLPAAWTSSANSLEALAHTAKDCVLVIDDFCPTGSAVEQSRLHAAADRVLRAQGNHSGRGRCRADGSVRPPKPPRGLIISTGEDLPRGQSLRARSATIQVEKDSVNWQQLTLCQQQSRKGIYAEATSAFLQWLASGNRIERLRNEASETIGRLRGEWLSRGGDAHKRSATTLAQLQRAWQVWLEFAADCRALDGDEIAGLREAVEIALDKLGQAQAGYQASENPAFRFIELLQAALTSGKAHLAAIDGGQPENGEAWGWRDGEAQGDRIGWIEGGDVFLQPDAAYRVAQSIGVNGEGVTLTARTLWKRLRETGFLASCESEERQTIKKQIGQTRPRVLHLRAGNLSGSSIV